MSERARQRQRSSSANTSVCPLRDFTNEKKKSVWAADVGSSND